MIILLVIPVILDDVTLSYTQTSIAFVAESYACNSISKNSLKMLIHDVRNTKLDHDTAFGLLR